MATVGQIKESVLLCRAAGITPMLWGHRGLGKSSIIKQICKQRRWGIIDFRCSQVEASDLRGLPARGEDERTHFLPPADMPIGDMTVEQGALQLLAVLGMEDAYPKKANSEKMAWPYVKTAEEIFDAVEDATKNDLQKRRIYEKEWVALQPRLEKGILFLDEPNRAQDDVMQAIFQLILDRQIGTYSLPPGWCVVCAGNFMEGYSTNGFTDPAFLDRFCHLTLAGGEQTLEDWVTFTSSVYGSDGASVIEFASTNTKHLDGEIQGDLGFSVQPSRRSWHSVIRVQQMKDQSYEGIRFSESSYTEVLSGLIGRELALSYLRYSCPVKPKDIIEHGVKAHSDALTKLDRIQFSGVMWGMVSFCKGKTEEDRIATVVLDFAEHMLLNTQENDLVVAFMRAMMGDKDNESSLNTAFISNQQLANMIAAHRKKQGNTKLTLLDRLCDRPKLQKALESAAWGR
jgi:MoxR-like ATPase